MIGSTPIFERMRGLSICGILTTVAMASSTLPLQAAAADNRRVIGPEEAPASEPAPSGGNDARSMYEAGERAYRRGRFQEALDLFGKAYDLSEQPLLLYNIALAHRQLYDVANDVGELRRGRAVLKNFMLFADRDPDLDATDAKKLLAEVEQLIADHKESTPEVVPGPGPDPVDPIDKPKPPHGKDPGRNLRIAGAVVMGTGGVMVVGGTIAGIFFAVRGKDFTSDLSRDTTRQQEECIDAQILSDDDCTKLAGNIEKARDNGRKSNLGVGLSFGIGGGLGLIAFGAGLGLFIQGNKRRQEWKAEQGSRVPRVYPTITKHGMGFGVSGRF